MPSEHHPTLPPSSFPMFALCPCYQSGDPGDAARSGVNQHRLLAALLAGDAVPDDRYGCDDAEAAQAAWARDYIVARTSPSRVVEGRLSLLGDDFAEITFGAPDVADVVNRADGDVLVLLDYKSGDERDYLPQTAAYARMAMQATGFARCEVHELYGRLRRAKTYVLGFADTDFVLDIIASVGDPDRRPVLCRYCSWCRHNGDCPESVAPIVRVAAEYEPSGAVARLPLAEVETWHASRISDPRQMSVVLQVAEHLGKWADAVKAHARAAALAGMSIPGYGLKEGRRQRRFVDIRCAYEASGLSAAEFLDCCDASVAAVERTMAAKAGHSSEKTKAAKADFARLMSMLVEYKENAPSLARAMNNAECIMHNA